MNNPGILFVMGVSGCGKSTIGKLLSQKLNIPFFDGDDYHPEANIKKMSQGQPLNDDDRHDWLKKLNELAVNFENNGAVIVCSALKITYRTNLIEGLTYFKFIYLKGSYSLILDRLAKRKNHFMPNALLKSQFNTLEEPNEAITISIDQNKKEIISDILKRLKN